MNNILYVMMGMPGSGKSYLAETLEDHGAVVISSDRIREELYGDAGVQSDPRAVFGLAHKRLRKSLCDDSVAVTVFDATNLKKKDRLEAKKIAEECGAKPVLVMFTTPMWLCMERNVERDRTVPETAMRKMAISYQRSCLEVGDEGWWAIDEV